MFPFLAGCIVGLMSGASIGVGVLALLAYNKQQRDYEDAAVKLAQMFDISIHEAKIMMSRDPQ